MALDWDWNLLNIAVYFLPDSVRLAIFDALFALCRNDNALFVIFSPFVVLTGVRLLCYPVFALFYYFDLLPQYRLYRFSLTRAQVADILLNFLLLTLVNLLLSVTLGAVNQLDISRQLPSGGAMLAQVLAMMLLSDLIHYCIHRMFHQFPALYRYHKGHHSFTTNINALIDTYGTLVEYLAGSVIPNIGAVGLLNEALAFAGCVHAGEQCQAEKYENFSFSAEPNYRIHIYTLWLFIVVVNAYSISQHSNYLLPYSPLHLVPFVNGDGHHAKHHLYNTGNYGEFFTLWDRLFGTLYGEDKPLVKAKSTS